MVIDQVHCETERGTDLHCPMCLKQKKKDVKFKRRAQQLLSDAHEIGEAGEVPSRPDEEFNEGEELEKVCFIFHFALIACLGSHWSMTGAS